MRKERTLKTAKLIENTLSYWEDTNCVAAAGLNMPDTQDDADDAARKYDRVVRSAKIRSYAAKACGTETFDLETYAYAKNCMELAQSGSELMSRVSFNRVWPLMFWLWCRHSRRVYHMSEPLQLEFAHTEVTTNRTALASYMPFDAFLLRFPIPYTWNFKDEQADDLKENGYMPFPTTHVGLLVTRVPESISGSDDPMLLTALIDERMLRYRSHGPAHRKKILSLTKQGKHDKLLGTASKILRRQCKLFPGFTPEEALRIDPAHCLLFSEELFWVTHLAFKDGHPFHLLANFITYLHGLPSNAAARSDWMPLEGRGTHQMAATRDAQVCEVGSSFTYTDREIDVMRENLVKGIGNSEMSAHFRRGHWRRARGTAHDPNAPKVIQVRPTVVRKDRLGKKTLPQGASVKIK